MSTQYNFDKPNGSFQTAADWSGGSRPGASDDALIDATDVATSSANATVNSISTGAEGELIIDNNSTFTATNGTVVSGSDTSFTASANSGYIYVEAGSALTLGD